MATATTLMSRASRSFDVVFFEEPVTHNRGTNWLRIERVLDNVTVGTPYVDEKLSLAKLHAVQRYFLSSSRAVGGSRLIAWYYTPMALAFASDLPADLTVYDCMDELSCFRTRRRRLPRASVSSWIGPNWSSPGSQPLRSQALHAPERALLAQHG